MSEKEHRYNPDDGFANKGHETEAEFAEQYNHGMKTEVARLTEAGADKLAPEAWSGAQTALGLLGQESAEQATRTFSTGEVRVHSDGSYSRARVEGARTIEDGSWGDTLKEPDFEFNGVPVSVEVADSFDYAHDGKNETVIDDKTRRTIVAIHPIAGTAKSREWDRHGRDSIPAMLPILHDKSKYDIEMAIKHPGPLNEKIPYPDPSEQITDLVVEFADEVPRRITFERQTGNPDSPTEKVEVSVADLLEDIRMDNDEDHKGLQRHIPDARVRKAAIRALEMMDDMFSDAKPQLEAIKEARIRTAEAMQTK